MSRVPVTIKQWQEEVHEWAQSKGWYDEPRTCGDFLSNIHAEISEAWEEFRNGRNLTEVYHEKATGETERKELPKPCGFPIELADAVIRIFDYAEFLGIDLADVMDYKMHYNYLRPHRHGEKRA